MPAYNQISLTTELTSLWGTYISKHKPHWYHQKSTGWEVARAWELYHNSLNSNLPMMVLGDETLRDTSNDDTRALLRNFGATSTRTPLAPDRDTGAMMGSLGIRSLQFGSRAPKLSAEYAPPQAIRTYDGTPHPSDFPVNTLLTQGSILSDLKWWPMPNDAWLLGAIHGLRTFHLRKVPRKEDVFDDKAKRPTVLGRELIGLGVFGYRRIASTHSDAMGHVLAPSDKNAALSATFTAYLDALKNFDSPEAILALYGDDRAIKYDEYDTPAP